MQQFKKSFFLISLFIITGIFSFGQRHRNDSLQNIVKEIAKSNIYEESYTIGYAGTISKQFQRFDELLTIATKEQLMELAAYNKNAVVRLYAYQALKRNKIKIPDTLIHKFRQDNSIVQILQGCIGDKKSVKELAQQDLKSSYEFSN